MSKRNSSHQLLLRYNTKKALVKGITVGIVIVVIYLAIVVIFGLAIGVGIQFLLTSYSKGLGCRLDKRRKGIFGGESGSTALSSFFSFFSLVPLGCCGSWLLILSMLPSIFGSSLSVVLIEYSRVLTYIGLAIVFGFAGLSALRLKKELNQRNYSPENSHFQSNDQYTGETDDKNKDKKEEVKI